MCNVIYISTTSSEDLSRIPTDMYSFEPVDAKCDDAACGSLVYPNKWFLICRYGGCSCHFRHVLEGAGSAPEFGPPEDWCPEDDDDVESTVAIYDLLARLVGEEHTVDVIDTCDGSRTASFRSINVSLSHLTRESFRFFENYRFDLTA